jgi:TusA-related sulfurtransferase
VKIFNIKTGEVLRVEATDAELTEIVVELLKGKYTEVKPVGNEDFVNSCRMSLNV